jgi:hypothetical protein
MSRDWRIYLKGKGRKGEEEREERGTVTYLQHFPDAN